MNQILTSFETLEAQAKQMAMACANYQRFAYKRVMKALKKFSKKAFVKATMKLSLKLEILLSAIMRALHVIEKTAVFRTLSHLSAIVVLAVHNDGLKFTGLLTALGYILFCLSAV